MDQTNEDWLSQEKFDFDIANSPSTTHDQAVTAIDDDDDEEVFFGPLTHKERCIATVVKEAEENRCIEQLNPEQQALILKESVLLSLMLKHGTPKGNSPIAVVHPMMREPQQKKDLSQDIFSKSVKETNKENLYKNKQSKLEINEKRITSQEIATSKQSRILQPKFDSLKLRPISQSSVASNGTRLPVFKAKSKSEKLDESVIVDQASLYGLNPNQLKLNCRSGLPLKQTSCSESQPRHTLIKADEIVTGENSEKTKPASNTNILNNSNSSNSMTLKKNLPHNNNHQKNLPQLQLRPPSARRSIASQGTPCKVNEVQVQALDIKKLAPADHSSSYKMTPVQQTAARKLINGRKLLSTNKEKCSSSPQSSSQFSEDLFAKKKLKKSLFSPPLKTVLHSESTKSNPPSTILLKQSSELELPQTAELSSSSVNINEKTHENLCHEDKRCELIVCNKNESKPTPLDFVRVESESTEKEFYKYSKVESPVESPPCLIVDNEIADNNHVLESQEEGQLLLIDSQSENSPIKTALNSGDPFQTGDTPPPLIELCDILEPEKSSEADLIFF